MKRRRIQRETEDRAMTGGQSEEEDRRLDDVVVRCGESYPRLTTGGVDDDGWWDTGVVVVVD